MVEIRLKIVNFTIGRYDLELQIDRNAFKDIVLKHSIYKTNTAIACKKAVFFVYLKTQ